MVQFLRIHLFRCSVSQLDFVGPEILFFRWRWRHVKFPFHRRVNIILLYNEMNEVEQHGFRLDWSYTYVAVCWNYLYFTKKNKWDRKRQGSRKTAGSSSIYSHGSKIVSNSFTSLLSIEQSRPQPNQSIYSWPGLISLKSLGIPWHTEILMLKCWSSAVESSLEYHNYSYLD